MPTDLLTSAFDFDLPPERIAQTAVEPRDHARLLQVLAAGVADHHVYDLPELLRPNDMLVMNDTRVIPARIYGRRGEMKVEILLHKKQFPAAWLAFARPGKRLKPGDRIAFADDFYAELLEKREDGEILIRFNAADEELLPLLEKHGEPPLPPYIHRAAGMAKKEDRDRYQTVYAVREGAVAAPTAGLHFTPELLRRLEAKGIESATVTLHVGAGTFLPVKAERVADHKMHAEWGEITAAAAERINRARRGGRRIVAVGTTSLRLLESAADEAGTVRPFAGDTAIFITPGYRFRAVDALMTNFHLPKSTLFMLVAAFAGLERMKAAYACAIAQNYRFYSYGDATFLERT
jgi:S-adenosylmethionine:tRNA ribosyltransferase-isomerase